MSRLGREMIRQAGHRLSPTGNLLDRVQLYKNRISRPWGFRETRRAGQNRAEQAHHTPAPAQTSGKHPKSTRKHHPRTRFNIRPRAQFHSGNNSPATTAPTPQLPSNMSWTDREITAWLDEMLPPARMAEFENQVRTDKALQQKVAAVIRSRDQGGNSIGEIWQRARLSCPSRSELGNYLLQTLTPEHADYIEFHLSTIGCRLCQANLADLEEQSSQQSPPDTRRRRFFESSAGLLRPNSTDDHFHSR